MRIEAVRVDEQNSVVTVRWRNPRTGRGGELPASDVEQWVAMGGETWIDVGDADEASANGQSQPSALFEQLRRLPRY
jgi:hypothetical protein